MNPAPRLTILAAILVLAGSVTGCDVPADRLVGDWQGTVLVQAPPYCGPAPGPSRQPPRAVTVCYEFRPGGKAVVKRDGRVAAANWQFLRGGRNWVTVALSFPGRPVTIQFDGTAKACIDGVDCARVQ
jgi:hypothetical protein